MDNWVSQNCFLFLDFMTFSITISCIALLIAINIKGQVLRYKNTANINLVKYFGITKNDLIRRTLINWKSS
jgi:hypothetical protein